MLLPACAALAAGCATPGAPAARIEFLPGHPELCGQSGSPICEARVNHAEGKPVPVSMPYAELAPGTHVLGLFCRYSPGGAPGDAQIVQREVDVALAPGGRYRVEAAMEPRPCTLTLVDEATGTPVGRVR